MRYKQKSERLRGSDLSESFPVNVRLENNYCRGFQQGLIFLFYAMREMKLENVSIEDVLKASDIAGSMRFRKMHPRWYGDVFMHKFRKAYLKFKGKTACCDRRMYGGQRNMNENKTI